MTVSGSLLFSRELGFRSNSRYNSKSKVLTEKGHLHLFDITLSLRASRQDAWSFHLLNSVHGLSPLTRCNVFVCRSFLTPSRGNEIPVLKTAATVLTRSYNAIHHNPLLVKLIPAISIIAFAAWGLGPLMRLSRILFLHKNDSSWNKSSSHHVLTSYLQPLLLWCGATLICRALEPVILPTAASQAVKQRLLTFVGSLSTVLAFSYCLASLIQQTQKFFVATKDSSDARNMSFEFAGKAIYTAVWVAAVSLFMELLGFSTQKWLTAGGLGTVLLTLAGREIFTNFLSSVMIHATRPFVANEWIQTKIQGYEVSGTVEHMGWWSPTIIRGDDREAVHIPNHKFTVNVVRNLTQRTHWRIKTHLAISHLDVRKINNIVADMRKVLAKHPQVEQKKLHRRVFLDNVDPESQALLIMVSCFVKTSHFEEYLCVKEAILLELLRVISHHRARLATPMRTFQKIYGEATAENIPYSDPIFTRSSRPAANDRSILLIEPPSYKITSDDKNKDSSTIKPDANSSSTQLADNTNNAAEKVTPPLTSEPDSKVKGSTITSSSDAKASNQEDVWAGATSDISAASGKQEGERVVSSSPATTRPALEDNIILGVALEGSKRTLPIEEETAPSPSTELKEMAAFRNGNGSEKKDDQIPAVRPVDQREKER